MIQSSPANTCFFFMYSAHTPPSWLLGGASTALPAKQATAAKYHQRMEHERKAREDAAKSIVMGLGDGLDSFDSDVLAGIADGIESVLRAPIGEDDSSS